MAKSKVLPLVITVTNPPKQIDLRSVTSGRTIEPLSAATGSETITIALEIAADG